MPFCKIVFVFLCWIFFLNDNMVFLGNKRSLICLFPSFCLFHQYKVVVDGNMLSPFSDLT